MTHPNVQRILVLNDYARDGAGVSEGWATTVFKRTHALALKACSDLVDHAMGVQFSWYPEDPGHLTVYRTSLATERTQVLRQLPLQDELAKTLEAELQVLAVARAEEALTQERQQALHRAAVARVGQLLRQAEATQPVAS